MPTESQENRNLNPQTIKNLPRQQKMAVVFLAVFAIMIIVLWVVQLSAQLNSPFNLASGLTKKNQATSTDPSLKDSDGDGISDSDEVNVYHTSPYLEDSDSDGINDKQEIEQGTDPNCASGKDCGTTGTASNGITNPNASSTDILDFGALTQDSLGTSTPSASEIGVTPTMIREELLKSGVEQATLDKISDADLLKIYEESINSQEAATTTSNTINQ
ncbi:MAG: hypothetical protein WCN88_04080 [Candidatus Falkowbacteria bacterium]